MRFERDLYFQVRANAHKPSKVKASFHLPQTEVVQDAEGLKVVPRTTLTLIERLMVKAGAMPAPSKAPDKPRRGRPSKVKGSAL